MSAVETIPLVESHRLFSGNNNTDSSIISSAIKNNTYESHNNSYNNSNNNRNNINIFQFVIDDQSKQSFIDKIISQYGVHYNNINRFGTITNFNAIADIDMNDTYGTNSESGDGDNEPSTFMIDIDNKTEENEDDSDTKMDEILNEDKCEAEESDYSHNVQDAGINVDNNYQTDSWIAPDVSDGDDNNNNDNDDDDIIILNDTYPTNILHPTPLSLAFNYNNIPPQINQPINKNRKNRKRTQCDSPSEADSLQEPAKKRRKVTVNNNDEYKYSNILIDDNDTLSSTHDLWKLITNKNARTSINDLNHRHCEDVAESSENILTWSLLKRRIYTELGLTQTGHIRINGTLKWKEWIPCKLNGATGWECIRSDGDKTCHQQFDSHNRWRNHADQRALIKCKF